MKIAIIILIFIVSLHATVVFSEEEKLDNDSKLTIDQRLELIELRLNSIESRVPSRYASLDCDTGKYDEFLFDSSNLIFFAACTKIEEYLEGHKITIQIGNPHSFNFSNVKGNLGYGKNIWDSFATKVEASTTTPIRSGSWHTMFIIINPSTPDQMRNFILELSSETAGATK